MISNILGDCIKWYEICVAFNSFSLFSFKIKVTSPRRNSVKFDYYAAV